MAIPLKFTHIKLHIGIDTSEKTVVKEFGRQK